MRTTTVIVVLLLVFAVVIYWIPLPPIDIGDGKLIIGGYPWQAPTPQSRSLFTTIGIIVTVIAVFLAILAVKFGKDIEGGLSEDLFD
ncbi:MAG: hypothetical protein NZ954_07475 [Thermofilaceae archaeon]|nr:hypothetical protein [Thermofilaceae archaeon]MCX8180758.1 hypothetical protein [Thermofilaceae archaeon]MDW8003977.1 hypothetical protein [Thermofilaceae archaeon]